jgi:hypothetical protein
MEYKVSGSSNYTAIAGTEITQLVPGTYLVRYKAAGSNPAGPAVTVIVPAYVAANQFGLIKAFEPPNPFDNLKVKLLTADDVTRTYYLSDDLDRKVAKGQIVSYGLNEDGDIGAMDTTDQAISVNTGLTVVSSSALSYGGITYDISDHVVVFTYSGTDPGTADSYNVASISEVVGESFTSPSRIYFKDGKAVVILIQALDD